MQMVVTPDSDTRNPQYMKPARFRGLIVRLTCVIMKLICVSIRHTCEVDAGSWLTNRFRHICGVCVHRKCLRYLSSAHGKCEVLRLYLRPSFPAHSRVQLATRTVRQL